MPHNTPKSAQWVTTNASGAVVSSGTRPLSADVLSCAAMNPGDHKSPTPWFYAIDREEYQNGTIYDRYANGNLYQLRAGPSSHGTLSQNRIRVPSYPTDELWNKALDRLNERVRGSLDLSTAIAEAGATARMLNVLDQFRSAFQIMRDRRLNFVLASGTLASSWYLQWRYGWSPLLSDLYGSVEEAARVPISAIENVRGSAKVKYDTPEIQNLYVENRRYPISVQRRGFDKTFIHLSFRTAGHDLDRWTSLNPASIAWELLPYSFVVDWFVDIGSYLRNLETSLLYHNSFVRGYYGELRNLDYRYVFSYTDKVANGSYAMNITSAREQKSYRRSILQSYPLPRLPSFQADLKSGQLAAAAALLTQAFSRSRPGVVRPRLGGPRTGNRYFDRWNEAGIIG